MSYGKEGLEVKLPSKLKSTIIRKKPTLVEKNPELLVEDCLANPIGSSKLEEISLPDSKVCILVCDITRPVPNKLFLT